MEVTRAWDGLNTLIALSDLRAAVCHLSACVQLLEKKTHLPGVAESVRSAATSGKVRHDARWRDAVVAHSKFRKLPIIVGGRVDGYNGTDGSLLEVKNRVRRLFNAVVDYEKVQLHVRCI